GGGILTLAGLQTLTGTYEDPVKIDIGTTAGINGATFTNQLTIQTNALLYVNYNQSLVISGTLTNFGTFEMFSRDVSTYLGGSGTVENRGAAVVYPVGNGGGVGQIRLQFENAADGTLRVATNASMGFYGNSAAISSGPIDIQDGAQLSLFHDGPPHDLTLLPGSQVTGAGALQLYGNNRLITDGDVRVSAALRLNDSSLATGGGILTLAGLQTLTGTYEDPVKIDIGTTAGINGATFTNQLTIQTNALLYVNYNQSLNVNGLLTNLGIVRLFSRDASTYLGGSGVAANLGQIEVLPIGNGGGQAHVMVPVDVPPNGAVAVRSNAWLNFGAGSQLTLAGTFDIEGGAVCLVENSAPARDLVLQSGAVISGQGNLTFYGGNRLNVSGNATLAGVTVSFTDSSAVTGTNLLTAGSAAVITLDHSLTMPGSLTILGTLSLANSSVVLTINNNLTLGAGGILNNPGTIEVGSYQNNGGTVNGNIPVLLGATGMVLSNLRLLPGPGPAHMVKAPPTAQAELVLDWIGPIGGRFIIERSSDLVHWSQVNVTVNRSTPRHFEANLGYVSPGLQFYRLRLIRN
ncbi:MAG TPA: hypothetical protein VKY92_26685, partial [Verrucomicrobiae bacterium]|nr:hypothetical protein [Verrucomicrobiae bacterium]